MLGKSGFVPFHVPKIYQLISPQYRKDLILGQTCFHFFCTTILTILFHLSGYSGGYFWNTSTFGRQSFCAYRRLLMQSQSTYQSLWTFPFFFPLLQFGWFHQEHWRWRKIVLWKLASYCLKLSQIQISLIYNGPLGTSDRLLGKWDLYLTKIVPNDSRYFFMQVMIQLETIILIANPQSHHIHTFCKYE